ncbi:MAG TPA: HAMP domain-containing sensor histidine kinase [Anaerolineales bacterium]|nr:HAMP domain-containing sensor histidine kinase [Anaerolineales bacterium]
MQPPPRYRMTRPSWWPENRPWPPSRDRFRHNPFFRRLGCFFGVINLLGFTVFILLVLFILRTFGPVDINLLIRWALPIGLGGLVLLALIAALSVRSLRRISAPLDDLHEAATRVAQGDYSTRVVERGPPEMRSLARAFNDMASRLHQTDEQRRNLLADTTHELLTPLTVIQGNLEGMLDGVYPADETNLRSILDETNLLSRLLEDLRTLALAESGALQLKKEPTEFLPYLHEVASVFQSQAATSGVTIRIDAADNLPLVDIDPPRMRQVLSNLLANDLRYSPAGGTIHLSCETDGHSLLLTIQDEGPGIPADDLQHVFERFYKSTDSGGMGLGLAIAKHLVEAHGGHITAENAPTRGTIFRISLPLST